MRLQISFPGSRSSARETRQRVSLPPAAAWPFLYPLPLALADAPALIVVPDLHHAFENQQTAGTRLVTTQAAFQVSALADLVGDRDVVIEATVDADALARHAPDLLGGDGLNGVTVTVVDPSSGAVPDPGSGPGQADTSSASVRDLMAAFRTSDAAERLALCVQALDGGRDAAALTATASVCMEVNDLEAAARDLDEAVALAPAWAAAHFERGKLWLRRDDMQRASDCFRAAADLMPRYGPAWANLGATLGELDRADEALAAFTRALACDPSSAQTHNNIGVVSRELGKLAESERAFRRVLELAPELAFGYYNLGHTLFLQGRYQAALNAYAEGQRRDAERNPVQATRLAMCRLATGDAAGAVAELQRATAALPADYRRQLLADTQSLAWALLTHRPDLAGWQQVHDWLARAQAR